MISKAFIGFPRWCSGKESACQGRRCRRCMMMPSPHAPNSHPPRTPHPTRDFCIHYWAGSISTSFHSPEKLRQESDTFPSWLPYFLSHTAAAAKSLQSCPTLCDPIDGSPPGSPVPGILQARTLEWVAISFSNA